MTTLVIFLVVFAVGFISWIVWDNDTRELAKDNSNWLSVEAKIINTKTEQSGKVVSMGSKNNVNSYHIYQPSKTTYAQIEYEIEGRTYRPWINIKKLCGRQTGFVTIKVLKDHPTYRRYPDGRGTL